MSDLKELLDREARLVDAAPEALEAVLRRRDRKRRNQRIAAGVVGIAVFVAAIWIVTSVSSLNRSETSVVPGGDVTGPAETAVENPEPPPLVEPVQIGTVTRSEAGCALEIVAEPIPAGAGRLTVVNETSRRVAFDLLRFDPDVLTFVEFEAFIASGEPYLWRNVQFGRSLPDGAFGLVQREVGPGSSGTITDNFWPGGTYAIACGETGSTFGGVQLRPTALVGPIEVETAPAETGPAETGPTETGPTETGPAVDADTGWIDAGSPDHDLPPEGAVPSAPVEGRVVDEFTYPGRFVLVYADGRVISYSGPGPFQPATGRINERRLTPEGVELVRSGEVGAGAFLGPGGLLTSAQSNVWEDPELKPFVPSRYEACYQSPTSQVMSVHSAVPFFPAPARAILLRGETRDATCSRVTTDEARSLLDILGAMLTTVGTPPGAVRIENAEGTRILWDITMILPHGERAPCTDCF